MGIGVCDAQPFEDVSGLLGLSGRGKGSVDREKRSRPGPNWPGEVNQALLRFNLRTNRGFNPLPDAI